MDCLSKHEKQNLVCWINMANLKLKITFLNLDLLLDEATCKYLYLKDPTNFCIVKILRSESCVYSTFSRGR